MWSLHEFVCVCTFFFHYIVTTKQVVKKVFGSKLIGVEDIRANWDWDTFVRGARPKSADREIKMQFALTLEVRREGTVVVRSKSAVSSKVPWSDWYQMYPHPKKPQFQFPDCNVQPPQAGGKEWKDLKQLLAKLQKFYCREFTHPVVIPRDDFREMSDFISNGPAPQVTPEWIKWDNEVCDSVDASNSDDDTLTVPSQQTKAWVPFLKGSNPVDEDTSSHSSGDEGDNSDSSTAFPYTVGTKVAMKFDAGVFQGEIIHHSHDMDTCVVRFTDGDECELDPDETHYAIQLWERDFGDSE